MSTTNQIKPLGFVFRENKIPRDEQSLYKAVYAPITNSCATFTLDQFIRKITTECKKQKDSIDCTGSTFESIFGSTLRTICTVCHVTIHVLEIVDLNQARYETYKFQAKYSRRIKNVFLLYHARERHFDELYITDANDTGCRRVEYSDAADLKLMFAQYVQDCLRVQRKERFSQPVADSMALDTSETHELDRRTCQTTVIPQTKRRRPSFSTSEDLRDSPSNKIARMIPTNNERSCSPELFPLSQSTGVPSATNLENVLRLLFEPTPGFRGRMRSEFKPIKSVRRDGTLSHARPPVYFIDADNKHQLTLLIPTQLFINPRSSIYLEVCMITIDIQGCVYIHPKFKFQINHKDYNAPDLNPRFLFIERRENQGAYNDFHLIFNLFLVPVMLTNNELLQNQPFKLFQGKIINQTPLPTINSKVDELNKTFQLDFVRFAFTPWFHTSNGYQRCVEHQYISQVSKQDRKYKRDQRQPKKNNAELNLNLK